MIGLSDGTAPKDKTIYLGLDVALRNTGWVVNEGRRLVASGTVKTKSFKKPKGLKQAEYFDEMVKHELEQVDALGHSLADISKTFEADMVVAELPTFAQSNASFLGLAWSIFAGADYGKLCFVLPNEIKKITGSKNRTSKQDIKNVVCKKYFALMTASEHAVDAQAALIYYHAKKDGTL